MTDDPLVSLKNLKNIEVIIWHENTGNEDKIKLGRTLARAVLGHVQAFRHTRSGIQAFEHRLTYKYTSFSGHSGHHGLIRRLPIENPIEINKSYITIVNS